MVSIKVASARSRRSRSIRRSTDVQKCVQICVSTGKARGWKCGFRCHLLAWWQSFRNSQELSSYTRKCLDDDQDHGQTVQVDQRLLKKKHHPWSSVSQALLFSNPDWSTLSQSRSPMEKMPSSLLGICMSYWDLNVVSKIRGEKKEELNPKSETWRERDC